MNSRRVRGRPGVSEVVGSLLLIIVVVTAVASLSYFLATAQQNSQNRSAYLTDLKNENFQVVYASFSWQGSGGPPGEWNQVVLSIRNANTLSSGLQDILVNGDYITTWYQVSSPGPLATVVSVLGVGKGLAPLLFPAKATEYIMLNGSLGSLPGGTLQSDQALQITLVTQSGNYFRTNWSPPTALASASVSPRNYQAVPQDELSFSGAQSYAGNGTVVGYSWTVSVPDNCSSPTGQDVASNIPGENLAYAPEALFANWTTDCLAGPITATLTVTDSNGFTATSQPVVLPPDPALAPPASLTLFSENPGVTTFNIIVQVSDAYGRPVAGQVITAVSNGNVTLASNSAGTDINGQAIFTVTDMNPVGSVLFQVASVPQLEVPYPQTYNPL